MYPAHHYWQPWMGHFIGLRPSDLHDMTPEQLFACFEFVDKKG